MRSSSARQTNRTLPMPIAYHVGRRACTLGGLRVTQGPPTMAAISVRGPSWREIEEGASTAVHREGHRVVDVRDPPCAVLAQEAGGGTEPQVDPLAVGLRPGHVAEAERVGAVLVDHDRQVAAFGHDRTVPGVEPLLDVARVALGGGVDAERRGEV